MPREVFLQRGHHQPRHGHPVPSRVLFGALPQREIFISHIHGHLLTHTYTSIPIRACTGPWIADIVLAWRDRSETSTSPGRELPKWRETMRAGPADLAARATQQTAPKTPRAVPSKASASTPVMATSRRDGAERLEPVARPGT